MMMMKSARFIVVEGGDAGGKSTQIAVLLERLRARGLDVVATFEPGATPAGAVMRELLLHGNASVSPTAEALLMAADRAQHVSEVIRPALDAGRWVVSDRFVPSSLVYQGVVRGLGVDAIDAMNRLAVGAAEPDLVLVLDVADDVIAARRGAPTDRLEAEGAAFHAEVREAYRTLARERGWVMVDGDGAVDVVAERVWHAVEPLLAG
jgi:dTMP kinase